MTGVQRQAEKLLEQIKDMSFIAARSSNMHLDIGKMEILLMALEKQVPEKPTNIYKDINCFVCSRCEASLCCESYVDMEETKYCPYCGQAIDWRNI